MKSDTNCLVPGVKTSEETTTTLQIGLMDVNDVARLLCCFPRTVYRLADSGRMPEPVRLGALVRWDRAALEEWIAAGCPQLQKARRAR